MQSKSNFAKQVRIFAKQIELCEAKFILCAAQQSIMQRVKTESEVLFVFAIVESGGKQYKVSEGDIIFVEKLNVNEGDTYTFEKVLAVSSPAGFSVGTPAVACTVTANVVKNGKGKKIHVIRYKSKKNEKKHIGHRQPYTKLQIVSIAL